MMEARSIARVCHEANRAFQVAAFNPAVGISPHWDELDPETQNGVVDGVQKAMNGMTPEALHESWMEYKIGAGWTWGPTKNDAAKTHPNLIDYDDLPVDEHAKDQLFANVVMALSRP